MNRPARPEKRGRLQAVAWTAVRMVVIYVAAIAVSSIWEGQWHHTHTAFAVVALTEALPVITSRLRGVRRRLFDTLEPFDWTGLEKVRAWVDDICAEYQLDVEVKALPGGDSQGVTLVEGGRAYVAVDVDQHKVDVLGDSYLQATIAHELVHAIRRHGRETYMALRTKVAAGLTAVLAVYAVATVDGSVGGAEQALSLILAAAAIYIAGSSWEPKFMYRLHDRQLRDEEYEADRGAIALLGPRTMVDAQFNLVIANSGSDDAYFNNAQDGKYPSVAEKLAWATGDNAWLDPDSEKWQKLLSLKADILSELAEPAAE